MCLLLFSVETALASERGLAGGVGRVALVEWREKVEGVYLRRVEASKLRQIWEGMKHSVHVVLYPWFRRSVSALVFSPGHVPSTYRSRRQRLVGVYPPPLTCL